MNPEYIIAFIPPQNIVVPEGREALQEHVVVRLMESYEMTAPLNPLTVRWIEDEDGGGYVELVTGLHRREAAIRLGYASVPVIQFELDDAEAELVMLEENAARKGADPLTDAKGTARRAALFEEIRAATIERERAQQAVWTARAAELAAEEAEQDARESDSLAFATAEANRLGVDVRTIQLKLHRHRNISDAAKTLVSEHPDQLNNVRFLDKLAREPDPAKQLGLIHDALNPEAAHKAAQRPKLLRLVTLWRGLSADTQVEALRVMMGSEAGEAFIRMIVPFAIEGIEAAGYRPSAGSNVVTWATRRCIGGPT